MGVSLISPQFIEKALEYGEVPEGTLRVLDGPDGLRIEHDGECKDLATALVNALTLAYSKGWVAEVNADVWKRRAREAGYVEDG